MDKTWMNSAPKQNPPIRRTTDSRKTDARITNIKRSLRKLCDDIDMVERSISPRIGANQQGELTLYLSNNQHDCMRRSTGGASKTQSFNSTFSPPQKSSTNSSIEKKQFKTSQQRAFEMRPGALTQLNNLREKKTSIKIPIKKDLMNDLIQKKSAGKFTQREKGNQKDKANSGYFILNPLSCEYSDGSGSENFFQLQK